MITTVTHFPYRKELSETTAFNEKWKEKYWLCDYNCEPSQKSCLISLFKDHKTITLWGETDQQTDRDKQGNIETRKQAVPTQSMNHADMIMMIMMIMMTMAMMMTWP